MLLYGYSYIYGNHIDGYIYGCKREPLFKGKAQYNWPACTNLFKSVLLYIENINHFITKQATLMRRSTEQSILPH
jgi:hypothetical protein